MKLSLLGALLINLLLVPNLTFAESLNKSVPTPSATPKSSDGIPNGVLMASAKKVLQMSVVPSKPVAQPNQVIGGLGDAVSNIYKGTWLWMVAGTGQSTTTTYNTSYKAAVKGYFFKDHQCILYGDSGVQVHYANYTSRLATGSGNDYWEESGDHYIYDANGTTLIEDSTYVSATF
jgi:hypothetical protein